MAPLKNKTSYINNSLLLGLKLQDKFFKRLLHFKHKIPLSAVITKMYWQIVLEKSAEDFHRILWRWNANDVLQHFNMARVTYGIATASFLCIRSLFEAARASFDKLASPIIGHDFYVDDLFTGAESVSECIENFRKGFRMSQKIMF